MELYEYIDLCLAAETYSAFMGSWKICCFSEIHVCFLSVTDISLK